jgi:hypothetical protein
MAAGVFGVTGPGPVALGRDARAYQRRQRLVPDLHAVGPPHPLPQRLIRGDALWAVEGVLQVREHGRGQGDRLAGWDIGGQSGRETSRSIQGQPATNRVAVDAQPAGRLLAAVSLAAGQQGEHLQTRFLVAIMCMAQALCERGDLFVNRWHGVVHGVPSRPA